MHVLLLILVVGNEIVGCASTSKSNAMYEDVLYDAARDGGKTRNQKALRQATDKINIANKQNYKTSNLAQPNNNTNTLNQIDPKYTNYAQAVAQMHNKKLTQQPQNTPPQNTNETENKTAVPKVIWDDDLLEKSINKTKPRKTKTVSRLKINSIFDIQKAIKLLDEQTKETEKNTTTVAPKEIKPTQKTNNPDDEYTENFDQLTDPEKQNTTNVIAEEIQANTAEKITISKENNSQEVQGNPKNLNTTKTPQLIDELAARLEPDADKSYAKILKIAMLKAATQDIDLQEQDLFNVVPKQRVVATKFNRLLRRLLSDVTDSDGQMSLQRAIDQIELGDDIPAIQINNVKLCTSVTGYGVYTPFKTLDFKQNNLNEMIVYAQLDDFMSQQLGMDSYQVKLSHEIKILDSKGKQVALFPLVKIIDNAKVKRRDFFVVRAISLPLDLSAGQYTVKLRMMDLNSNASAESQGVKFNIIKKIATKIDTDKINTDDLDQLSEKDKDALIKKYRQQIKINKLLEKERSQKDSLLGSKDVLRGIKNVFDSK